MILGEATIRANGEEWKTTGTAKFHPGGKQRTEHTGGGKVRGFSEKTVVPYIECQFAVDEDVDVIELNAITDATITFDGNNGLSYMLTGATLAEPIGISDEGTTDTGKWVGKKAKKI
ncbi:MULTISPECIES: phage tail tube protein [Vibrio]|uniref:Phage tail tube protein n=1 Tax=Vibrio spartinae TaxID=1918945 RepID=A0A1N6M5Y2_9VIBR|nr:MULTISPECIES: phage tail tube protein [Vibrio]WNJ96538.1 phage tail tube protein [Vibrio ruber]SIO94790.1 Phage tail tube protein [Vibrio spartinae]